MCWCVWKQSTILCFDRSILLFTRTYSHILLEDNLEKVNSTTVFELIKDKEILKDFHIKYNKNATLELLRLKQDCIEKYSEICEKLREVIWECVYISII